MIQMWKIRYIALERGMPLHVLAQKVGITPTNLSRIQRENTVSIDTLDKIADVLCVSPSVFFKNAHTPTEQQLIDMIAEKDKQLAEKDARIKELTDKLLARPT